MSTMTKSLIGCAAIMALGISTTSYGAEITDELPGNLFHQTGAPVDGNVSIAPNGPQNTNGAGNVVGSSGYPVGTGNSPILDGNVATGYGWGRAIGGKEDVAMANVGLTRGYYENNGSSFVTVPFTSSIGIIRIWAAEYYNSLDPVESWTKFPDQIKITFTDKTNLHVWDGNTYNSNTLGTTPSAWDQVATISSINGGATSAPANTVYDYNEGWINLDGEFIRTAEPTQSRVYYTGYIDLAVSIPAGTTSILISFGQVNNATGHLGGLDIREIQAIVPEPASLGLLGMAGLGLLTRRRRMH